MAWELRPLVTLRGLLGQDIVVASYNNHGHRVPLVIKHHKKYHFGAVMKICKNIYIDDYVNLCTLYM